MRLGVTFGELIDDVRAELKRSTELSHGIGDVTHIKRAINSEYRRLYDDYEWPHLARTFPRFAMAAGQYRYDTPDGLDIHRTISVTAWWGGTGHPVERGIGAEEYSQHDSVLDERSDPVLRYDINLADDQTTANLEVWPVPASAQCSLEIRGTLAISTLVNDSDVCLLDAESVVLFAAWKLADSDKKEDAERAAVTRLKQVRGRQPDGRRIRMGLGEAGRVPSGKAVVRVR